MKTFGQVAYEEWESRTSNLEAKMTLRTVFRSWNELNEDSKAVWKSVAQAVIDAKEEHDLITRETDPFGIGFEA